MGVIDQMTLPEVNDLFDYWTRNPPLHELAAAYIGFKPAPKADDSAAFGEFYSATLAMQ